MKFFLQIFTFLLFSFNTIYANDLREIGEISLKKDEQKKILVKYNNKKKLFKFSWTLYKNGGLVIFRSYDEVVAQNVLYLRHQNQSFRVELKPRGSDSYNVPYLLIKFKKFNEKTAKAEFDIFLSDDKFQIILQDLQNN